MLIDLAVDLAALIEATIPVQKVAVTAGRPAQSDKCSAAYVWGSQIFDAEVSTQARGDIQGCVIKRAYVLNYRIDVCRTLPEDGSEQTVVQQAAEADELYTYSDQVFCAIADNIIGGTLFDAENVGSCEDIVLGATVFDPPQGDRVSAVGSVRVTDPCPPVGS